MKTQSKRRKHEVERFANETVNSAYRQGLGLTPSRSSPWGFLEPGDLRLSYQPVLLSSAHYALSEKETFLGNAFNNNFRNHENLGMPIVRTLNSLRSLCPS